MPEITRCRICSNADLYKFLDLGSTPLANSFLKSKETRGEKSYPLNVLFCPECGLVQLGYAVPPEVLFRDYIYFSSTTDVMRLHFAKLAEEVLERFSKPDALVVEVASNDGVLLRNMLGKGVRILGVEPATNIAEVANKSGVETLNDFFDSDTAAKIASRRGKAAVILANNVFAHIFDLHDFVKGLDCLLEPDGVIVIEVPYLVDMFEKKEFDTIYHEHLAYFSIKPLVRLFDAHGMEIFEVKRVPVHGGSIRIYVQRNGAKNRMTGAVKKLLAIEERMGLHARPAYDKFANDVERLRTDLTGLLKKLKSEGKRIAGYGAPAKGNTLLNYFKIGSDLLDYTVDKSQYKVGLFTPGMRLPIYAESRIIEDKPDYVLILAWNFSERIVEQEREYLDGGGHFIVPVPSPRIIGRGDTV